MAVYRLKPVPLPPWGSDPGNAPLEHEQLIVYACLCFFVLLIVFIVPYVIGVLSLVILVVSTILIVQNSGLTASALTPEFDGMLDCLGHLWRQPGQLGTMRGASMLRRFSTKG